jgi:hypothetical protein
VFTQQVRLSRSSQKKRWALGTSGGARRSAEERGGIRGRSKEADRPDADIAISSVKGGGAFWVLQSKAL